ncbi:uncharacterized protein FRV6_05148 [Fusarium oxysporum]|uniref:Uncharacterized protein n=1 Tax=Fusarium oxysporum TaxID=5507 RepID=A0A2H3T5K4_FUSOX|nr:uncharacterized protein FRV6_05148 [Fusarium oxysporum]
MFFGFLNKLSVNEPDILGLRYLIRSLSPGFNHVYLCMTRPSSFYKVHEIPGWEKPAHETKAQSSLQTHILPTVPSPDLTYHPHPTRHHQFLVVLCGIKHNSPWPARYSSVELQ